MVHVPFRPTIAGSSTSLKERVGELHGEDDTGSTTSIKDKVLPFSYHVRCGSVGTHSLSAEREHLLAVPGSLYVLVPCISPSSFPRASSSFPLQQRLVPFRSMASRGHHIA